MYEPHRIDPVTPTAAEALTEKHRQDETIDLSDCTAATQRPARKARVIELPIVHDVRGNLTVVEGGVHVPFDIKRTYHLYDVPGGSHRGGHGHRELQQLIIAMSGSFDVHLDDGFEAQTFSLNRSYVGVYVPPMHWRVIDNFSSGAVCMVLASARYDESDYFRDYDTFVAAARGASNP